MITWKEQGLAKAGRGWHCCAALHSNNGATPIRDFRRTHNPAMVGKSRSEEEFMLIKTVYFNLRV